MKSAEPWVPGRERAGPPGCFSILVTSLFQCALHTPRSPMQSQALASRGDLSFYIGGSCTKNALPCILRNTQQFCTPVSEGDKRFNFIMELIWRWYFWQENEDQQYVIGQGSVKHSCWLLFVCPKWEDLFLHLKANWKDSVRKEAVSFVRTQITTHSDAKRVKNTIFSKSILKIVLLMQINVR